MTQSGVTLVLTFAKLGDDSGNTVFARRAQTRGTHAKIFYSTTNTVVRSQRLFNVQTDEAVL